MAMAKPLQVLPLQPQIRRIRDRNDVVDHIAELQIAPASAFLAKAFDLPTVIVAKLDPFRVITALVSCSARRFMGAGSIAS